MTDQLREAIDDVDQGRDYLVPHDIEAAYGSWAAVVDAARKWLAVTESAPIHEARVAPDDMSLNEKQAWREGFDAGTAYGIGVAVSDD